MFAAKLKVEQLSARLRTVCSATERFLPFAEQFQEHWDLELELPLGLQDEPRRPGAKIGMARWCKPGTR
jgi:hypothetical protein